MNFNRARPCSLGTPVLELVQQDSSSEHAARQVGGELALVAGQLPHHPAEMVGHPGCRGILLLSTGSMQQRRKLRMPQTLPILPHALPSLSSLRNLWPKHDKFTGQQCADIGAGF